MVAGAVARRGERHLVGIGFLEGDHILQALVRRIDRNRQHVGRLHRHADVVEILERIVAGVPGQVRPDHERAQRRHEHRVAIGRRALDDGGADHSGGARPVVDHEAAAEFGLELRAQDTRDVVCRASGRERDQHRDGLLRPRRLDPRHGNRQQHGRN
ncbi:hypothetical protein D3C72_1948980 [compost metagenome]